MLCCKCGKLPVGSGSQQPVGGLFRPRTPTPALPTTLAASHVSKFELRQMEDSFMMLQSALSSRGPSPTGGPPPTPPRRSPAPKDLSGPMLASMLLSRVPPGAASKGPGSPLRAGAGTTEARRRVVLRGGLRGGKAAGSRRPPAAGLSAKPAKPPAPPSGLISSGGDGDPPPCPPPPTGVISAGGAGSAPAAPPPAQSPPRPASQRSMGLVSAGGSTASGLSLPPSLAGVEATFGAASLFGLGASTTVPPPAEAAPADDAPGTHMALAMGRGEVPLGSPLCCACLKTVLTPLHGRLNHFQALADAYSKFKPDSVPRTPAHGVPPVPADVEDKTEAPGPSPAMETARLLRERMWGALSETHTNLESARRNLRRYVEGIRLAAAEMAVLATTHPLLDAFVVTVPWDASPGAAADGVGRINNLALGCVPGRAPSWAELNAAWGCVVCAMLAIAKTVKHTFAESLVLQHSSAGAVVRVAPPVFTATATIPLYDRTASDATFLDQTSLQVYDVACNAVAYCMQQLYAQTQYLPPTDRTAPDAVSLARLQGDAHWGLAPPPTNMSTSVRTVCREPVKPPFVQPAFSLRHGFPAWNTSVSALLGNLRFLLHVVVGVPPPSH